MPSIPKVKALSASSVDILNAIRNNATAYYKNYVPVADKNSLDSVRAIGNIMMQFEPIRNEFVNALMNRIGFVYLQSKSFRNPWAAFKRGMMEYGETIEEIFVDLAQPFIYDPEVAEKEVFKREFADVKSAFHTMNYQIFYKQTINDDALKQAFLSWDGVADLIAKIVEAMYNAANVDEFLAMKYMLGCAMLNGRLYPYNIPTVEEANMKGIAASFKSISNILVFPSNEYNPAGVTNFSTKDEQYLIVNAKFDAVMDVEVLASAFNMDKAQFMGHRVLIDSFGNLDWQRLGKLFGNNAGYREFSEAEIQALDEIPAVLVDERFFMIFDNMQKFTENYNGQGIYWNYFYHTWKTFSTSPFANALLFTPTEPTVNSVTLSPAAITVSSVVPQRVQLACVVESVGFAPKTVEYTVDLAGVTVSPEGKVSIQEGVTGTATVTATSTYDSAKTATATITIQ